MYMNIFWNGKNKKKCKEIALCIDSKVLDRKLLCVFSFNEFNIIFNELSYKARMFLC